jgi:thiamine kinase-like enzyme
MHPRDAAAIAREAVPGSSEPALSLLGSGLLNETYRVVRDGRAFSMRVSLENLQGPRVQACAWELEVLRSAAQRGLAAPLVCGDAARGVLVQEWLAGQAWSARAVREAVNIGRMADLLKRVHGLPQPAPGRVMTPSAWVKHYETALDETALHETALVANAGIAAPLAAAAAVRLARLEALPRPAAVVCHSDLHPLNLLDCRSAGHEPDSLKLLDWEYAHVSEPLWDLAGWGANNDFPDPELQALLRAYLERAPQESEWMRCKLLLWLYDYVCLCWSKLYLNSQRYGAADGADRPDMGAPGVARRAIAARAQILSERLAASV